MLSTCAKQIINVSKYHSLMELFINSW